ncbi:hypothetical protein ACFVVC_01145 [Pseudarthrobacter sp. NPDC058196]|uniref:hypothetical protein n=1 Tax=Pseudarthrobacter sp. NPDC058196 TaxID=3346376 RepID=UPI0036DA29ED
MITRITQKPGMRRGIAVSILAALLIPVLMMLNPASAFADDNKDERDNYSLYQLASNSSTYFSQENSPEGKDKPEERMNEDWRAITANPATGGDMLGYADPEFSLFNVVGWLFAEATGSTQTIGYDTLNATASGSGKNVYAGMVDYAHFGAANADLGLDTMSSGIGGQILALIGGGAMWLLYAMALAVGTLFYLIIQLLKVLNPFMWFYQAVAGVADSSGNTNSAHQQDLADGMTGSQAGGGALAGLQHWIASWYGLLQSIAWEALVPLFIGFLIIGLVLFKKMDRGSAIKKLVVRVVFIGVGLPLLGSMYTGVLDKFDDSLLGQHAGPTRVVLSTYVDFEAWMMNDRLGVPDEAVIAWDNGQASNNAMMSVRTTALAINKQAHGATFRDINVGPGATNAETAWKNSLVGMEGSPAGDFNAVGATFGMLNSYISGQITSASDFESGIKSAITNLPVSSDVKKEWFIDKKSYGDSDNFGGHGESDYVPTNHPVLAVGGKGLTSSNPGGNTTSFSTQSTKHGCGFSVWADNAPVSCNMSALSAYNYLNTGFGPDSMTMYSSNNVTSGLTREDHMAVSQVGTGPAKFMYWQNAGVVLGSMVLLGFWYAIGMLVGAVKRTFSLVAAVPFATLGAIAAISKVIVYSVALILEVLVTLFIYQFVSELLISIPDIISGPVSAWMSKDGLWGSGMLGGIIVVILTLISSLLIIGITFALLRVRKVVLQAMDEVFTKLVDKFLDTNTAPKPDKSGMLPALAAGAGAGAGMAVGNKLASGVGGKLGGSGATKPGGTPGGGKGPSTNAGGLNGEQNSLAAGKGALALAAGPNDGPEGGPDGGSPAGPGPVPGGGGDSGGHGPSAGGPEGPGDKGGPLQLTGGKAGSSRSDKETAQTLSSKGGLSNLGYSTGQGPSSRGGQATGGQTGFGFGGTQGGSGTGQPGQVQGQKQDGVTGSTDSGARTSSGRKGIAGQSAPTQFGSGQQASSASPEQGPRFTAGTGGPAQVNPVVAAVPGIPGTRATRAAEGQPPQAKAGSHAVQPGPGVPQAGGTQRRSPQAPVQAPTGQGNAHRAPVQPRTGTPAQAQGQSGQRPQAPSPAPVQPRAGGQVPGGAQGSRGVQPVPRSGRRTEPQVPAQAPKAPAPQPSQQVPAQPRRTPDPAPKHTDGPTSRRKPAEDPKD